MRAILAILLAIVAMPVAPRAQDAPGTSSCASADGAVFGVVTVPRPGSRRSSGTTVPPSTRIGGRGSSTHTFTLRCRGGLGGRRIAVDGLGPC